MMVTWKRYLNERGFEYYRGKLGKVTVAFVDSNTIRSAGVEKPVLAICSLTGAVRKERFFTVEEGLAFIEKTIRRWMRRANVRKDKAEENQQTAVQKISKKEKFTRCRIIR